MDTRVICIAPIVLDALNLHANLHHMWRAFGGWTFAFKDYYAENFTQVLDDNATLEMFSIVDPYAYKDRFATIPKLVIDAGGDEFLMVDDNHYWYAEMPGETHLLMVQDADHGMSTGLEQLVPSLVSFLQAVYLDTPRPQMSWKFGPYPGGGNGNSITLTTSEVPLKVETWHADTLSKTRRDWRLATGETPCPTKIIPSPGGDACLQPVLYVGAAVWQKWYMCAVVGRVWLPGGEVGLNPSSSSSCRACVGNLLYHGLKKSTCRSL